MKRNQQQSYILAQQKVLNKGNAALKSEFIGLDTIIDEVQTLVRPWFMFPENQVRPTVINLWGMTGTGKTALVKRMSEHMGLSDSFMHLDVGEFNDNGEVWLKQMLTEDLIHFDGKPVIICLDEFQFARTLNEGGKELEKDKLRILWSLLDSGKVSYNPEPSQYYMDKTRKVIQMLAQCMAAGVKLEKGKITKNVKTFQKVFKGFRFYYYHNKKKKSKKYFLEEDFLYGLYLMVQDDYTSAEQLKDVIKKMSLNQLKDFMIQAMNKEGALKEMDLSKALIFVIGNLDEAFSMSSNINPDISADDFYRRTLKIQVPEIKMALQNRFRNEQIARLGNNHIIYPAFSKAHYFQLIERQLDDIKKQVKKQAGIQISFTPEISKLVYKEGVFPAQGVRPVFTTVHAHVQAYVSRILCDINLEDAHVKHLMWSYSKKTFSLVGFDKKEKEVWSKKYPVKLKIDHLRKSKNDDQQAHTAVHEAGHAILAALTLRILPEVVVSRTADAGTEGFCQVNFPPRLFTRELVRKDIIITLGGWIAEKMIFGPENTSTGVWSDIQLATERATHAIQSYAMGSDPVRISMADARFSEALSHRQEHDDQAIKLIKACEKKAEEMLARNKKLLLKMAAYLTINARMKKKKIRVFVEKYSVEKWVRKEGFIKPKEYFRFKDVIENELKNVEEPGGE